MKTKAKKAKKKLPTLAKMKRRIANLRNRIILSENYLTAISTPKPEGSCKKTSKSERAERLINLAADPGAREEESRTSATLAAKLIKRENLKICG
ncbi:MAG: hypothetical protein WBY94_04615 [Polyangiaceae bacterium]|jgi:hypothetical protein